MCPIHGSNLVLNISGGLIVRMVAKTQMCALGNTSASLFVAPKTVAPRVIMSSQAVYRFKAQGYTLNSVLLTGHGSEANPHSWYIVMSK